jgi:hypothetical protein
MPSTIAYVNQHSREIVDALEDFEDDGEDNLSYKDSAQDDKLLMLDLDQDSAQEDTDSDNESESDGNDNDDDHPGSSAECDESDPEDPALLHPNDGQNDEDGSDDNNDVDDNHHGHYDNQHQHGDSSSTSSDNEQNGNKVVIKDVNNPEHQIVQTKSDLFEDAHTCRHANARSPESTLPKRMTKSTQQDDYVYNTFSILLDQLSEQQSFFSPQMSAKAGL